MCPDHELLSAYVDGEVPSPWRERIAEHLASCPDCAATVESYTALGTALRDDVLPGEEEALERIRSRLDEKLAGIEAAAYGHKAVSSIEPSVKKTEKDAFWKRSIRLPLPIAAAAVLVVVALGGITTGLALGARRTEPKYVANQPTVISPTVLTSAPAVSSPAVQPTSMEELLRFLDAHDAQVTITMNLPIGTRFDESGEPVIIRASQESRGVTQTAPLKPEGRKP